MSGSRIGSTSQSQARNKSFSTTLFRLLFLFAAITNFTVGSHNLHSYKKSQQFHKSCIEKFGGVWLGQELWLTEKQIPTMTALGVQFVARSGMENAVSTGILRGRPYGGVSVAWSADLNHVVKPLVNYKHPRVVCIKLEALPSPIIISSIYMPFFNTSKRQECTLELIDAISMLQSVIDDHPNHKFIIGGDFNTELKNNLPFDSHWEEFIAKNDLELCDRHVTSQIDYTYRHDSLNQSKWNDHFVMSSSLVNASSNHQILEDGADPSDHLPIMMQVCASLQPSPPFQGNAKKHPSLKWEKCSEDETAAYTAVLNHILQVFYKIATNVTVKMFHVELVFRMSTIVS